ncbi:lipoyl(octanoyl) transferase LipB [Geoalkalibacter halelectricus]|uniref:Octanoyltransferase n=1 Tax=Geoalkalibacter halelectricus TaxID=2847045 RepID=A0ABY5ZTY1_9BACT|nr:lipoyl(octanoyl) transferase LipB [Geoalkalibacter halelectricus]MDO3377621.1 lipoyl(octanoyl) transferase LipB [Geoalkalibacter halelectricus]UWZ81412.1 lipoyl(octanoyl) transferase LipB [Geoalkalibacter halelectricus]
MTNARSFMTLRAGRLDYSSGLALQELLVERRLNGGPDLLVLLEHEPVITLGRGARDEHVLLGHEELARRGIEIHRVGRGGDVTWHGPGQLVAYPIIHLDGLGRDLHAYLRRLEETLILTLAAFGVPGQRRAGKTGVWVEARKIASIGVGVRRWVAWHGLALNVDPDLEGFRAIVPCGLSEVAMTSLGRECARSIAMAEVEDALIEAFATTFSLSFDGEYEPPPATQA